MNIELIIAILLGLSTTAILYAIASDSTSLLEERIKKVSKKDKTQKKTIIQNISEVLGQLEKNNTKDKKILAKNKLLLMQAGEASTEEAIIIYEGRKILIFITLLIFSLIVLYFTKKIF